MIRKGTLYCLRPSTQRCSRNIEVIGVPDCPLYPLTGMGLSSFSKGVFRNLESFLAHLTLKRVKAFALELASVVVLTSHPLQDKIYRIVKLFLLNS